MIAWMTHIQMVPSWKSQNGIASAGSYGHLDYVCTLSSLASILHVFVEAHFSVVEEPLRVPVDMAQWKEIFTDPADAFPRFLARKG